MRAPHPVRFALLPVLLAAAVLGGCGDSGKDLLKPPRFPTYLANEFPDRVLSNLQTAYSNRDSVEYRNLFDYDYVGTSEDMTDGTNATFHNADEMAHIQALAQAPHVVGVSLSLGPSTSWLRLPSDDLAHPEWAMVQISGSFFSLTVNDTDLGDLTVTGSNETLTFAFKPTTPAPTSVSDTLWSIIRWKEVRTP